ncbi:hypothetical protein C0389_06890 [bacterium]|nr:hypothetical protein [bacterium]
MLFLTGFYGLSNSEYGKGGSGGGGTSNHAALINLDYSVAGHTGFASQASYNVLQSSVTELWSGSPDYVARNAVSVSSATEALAREVKDQEIRNSTGTLQVAISSTQSQVNANLLNLTTTQMLMNATFAVHQSSITNLWSGSPDTVARSSITVLFTELHEETSARQAADDAIWLSTPTFGSGGGSGNVSTIGGTTNYLSKFSSTTSIVNSSIFDNGTYVGIKTTNLLSLLTIGDGTGITAAQGLNFGDISANLYRSAAGTIKTDGVLRIGTMRLNNYGIISQTDSNAGLGLSGWLTTQAGYDLVINNSGDYAVWASGEGGTLALTTNFGSTSAGIFNGLLINGIINQGAGTGITRGLYINPTLTAAYDFRAIQTTGGKVVFGGMLEYADNAAAVAAGLPVGTLYRTVDVVKIVH